MVYLYSCRRTLLLLFFCWSTSFRASPSSFSLTPHILGMLGAHRVWQFIPHTRKDQNKICDRYSWVWRTSGILCTFLSCCLPSHLTPWRSNPCIICPHRSQKVGRKYEWALNRWGMLILNLSFKYCNGKQINKWTDKWQSDRWFNRQTDWQTDGRTDILWSVCCDEMIH